RMFSPQTQFAKSVTAKDLQIEVDLNDVIISPDVKRYIAAVNKSHSGKHGNEPMVEVNESVGILAFAYEKLRNSVEYREDHVLLRGAIKRILKRRLNPLWQYESIASALLRELIWARYLKNDSIPQTKVAEIEEMLRKYNILRRAMVKVENAEDWQDWILGIAACDIEQVLVDRTTSNALAEVMYQSVLNHVQIDGLSAKDRDVQIYLAVHRTLLKSDATLMTYHLFLLNAAGWKKASVKEAEKFVEILPALKEKIGLQLNYPKSRELSRIIKRHAPPFVVLD